MSKKVIIIGSGIAGISSSLKLKSYGINSTILDKGNSQARNIDAELSQYDIKWLKYSLNIPVNVSQRKD